MYGDVLLAVITMWSLLRVRGYAGRDLSTLSAFWSWKQYQKNCSATLIGIQIHFDLFLYCPTISDVQHLQRLVLVRGGYGKSPLVCAPTYQHVSHKDNHWNWSQQAGSPYVPYERTKICSTSADGTTSLKFLVRPQLLSSITFSSLHPGCQQLFYLLFTHEGWILGARHFAARRGSAANRVANGRFNRNNLRTRVVL
jgi:hypothetical protein